MRAKVVWVVIAVFFLVASDDVGARVSRPPRPQNDSPTCSRLLEELNHVYIAVHSPKEEAYWQNKMALSGYQEGSFEEKEKEYQAFVRSGEKWIKKIEIRLRKHNLSLEERDQLKRWLKFFKSNLVTNPSTLATLNKLIDAEERLYRARYSDYKSGYKDPNGKFKETSSVALGVMISTEKDEALRKAAFEGLRDIETLVLKNNFIEIVKLRNEFARALGYKNYFDYRVKEVEGISLDDLFKILDDLEVNTREACKKSLLDLVEAKDESAKMPWNFGFLATGETKIKADPYFLFQNAFEVWVQTLSALGVNFRGATLRIDLLDRMGKYKNGFMHGPLPAYVEVGKFHPATIHFAANANPNQVGSGQNATHTCLHEGGHAAHFANNSTLGACDAQEHIGSSVSAAEMQAMFFDAFSGDPRWLARYLKSQDGTPIPENLIAELVFESKKMLAYQMRGMLIVPYAEKALYEMSDSELTAENILKVFREIEEKMVFTTGGSARPILSIPHLLEMASSGYYYGYVLAKMGVFQGHAYFINRDGSVVDNPRVGPELARLVWAPGNSKPFAELVKDLTGKPFSAAATIAAINEPEVDTIDRIAREVRIGRMADPPQTPVSLDATIDIMNGDAVITTNAEGKTLAEMAEDFKRWIARLEREKAEPK